MRPLPLLLAFFGLPLAEIAVFVAVGSQIGVGWTLLLVVASFLLGILVVRRQSLSALQAVRTEARLGRVPERQIATAAFTVLAGLLLMVPGFITSAFGLLLLIAPLREAMLRALGARIVVQSRGRPMPSGRRYPAGGPASVEIVDLEEDEFERRAEPDPSTPWRRIDDTDGGPR